MNYYVSSKPNEPFVSFFSTQVGTVKTVMIHTFEEKILAKQISKLLTRGVSEANIAFSSEITKLILTTPGLYDRLSNILENEYSIAIDTESEGSHLHIYAVSI